MSYQQSLVVMHPFRTCPPHHFKILHSRITDLESVLFLSYIFLPDYQHHSTSNSVPFLWAHLQSFKHPAPPYALRALRLWQHAVGRRVDPGHSQDLAHICHGPTNARRSEDDDVLQVEALPAARVALFPRINIETKWRKQTQTVNQTL